MCKPMPTEYTRMLNRPETLKYTGMWNEPEPSEYAIVMILSLIHISEPTRPY